MNFAHSLLLPEKRLTCHPLKSEWHDPNMAVFVALGCSILYSGSAIAAILIDALQADQYKANVDIPLSANMEPHVNNC